MKHLILLLTTTAIIISLKAQKPVIGLKGGLNISKLASEQNIHFKNKNGFMISAFLSPRSSVFGYRTEIVFSRQGFTYDSSGRKQEVQSEYVYLPQLFTVSIRKVLQLQAGGQIGYLLKSEAVSTNSSSTQTEVTDFMNRLDYGAAAGFELYPLKKLIIGSRYNISFGKAYEEASAPGMMTPLLFNPNSVKGKNAVIQFFAGVKL